MQIKIDEAKNPMITALSHVGYIDRWHLDLIIPATMWLSLISINQSIKKKPPFDRRKKDEIVSNRFELTSIGLHKPTSMRPIDHQQQNFDEKNYFMLPVDSEDYIGLKKHQTKI